MSSVSKFALALVAIAACSNSQTTDNVPAGSLPAALEPVGPAPGPKSDAAQATNPYPQDRITINQGRVYFSRFNCDGCHGGRAGGGMGPSLRDNVWLYGNSDAQIFDSIAQGRGHGMPAWGMKLPDEIVWKLVAYIHSLRTPDEPEAPDQTVPPPPDIPIP